MRVWRREHAVRGLYIGLASPGRRDGLTGFGFGFEFGFAFAFAFAWRKASKAGEPTG